MSEPLETQIQKHYVQVQCPVGLATLAGIAVHQQAATILFRNLTKTENLKLKSESNSKTEVSTTLSQNNKDKTLKPGLLCTSRARGSKVDSDTMLKNYAFCKVTSFEREENWQPRSVRFSVLGGVGGEGIAALPLPCKTHR